jgi:hypothetical protein
MAKNKKSSDEFDTVYILKIVLYLIIGSQWLRLTLASGTEIPIPLGALVGLVFASHEHFKIDRKIEYAVLLVSMFIGFWLPLGLEITLH